MSELDAIETWVAQGGKLTKADARRLISEVRRQRLALIGLVDWLRGRYPPRMGGGEYPPSLAPLMLAAAKALGDVP